MRARVCWLLLALGCAPGKNEPIAPFPPALPAESRVSTAPSVSAAHPVVLPAPSTQSDLPFSAPAPAPTQSAAPPGLSLSPDEKPGAIWPPPSGWAPPPCEVEAFTTLVQRDGSYEVTARLKNRTKRTLEFDVPDRCPQGPAYFNGLGQTYDYYGSCVAGACPPPGPAVHYRISPGQSIEVTTIRVEPDGNGCNAPLEPGTYFVSFGVSTGHVLCGGPAAHFDRKAPPAKARKASAAKKCPPQPACGIACPGGSFARDENGCSTCGCAKGPSVVVPAEPGRPGF